jgi:hypothetical protein
MELYMNDFDTTEESLLNSLNAYVKAYVKNFGTDQSSEDIQAIASSILAFQQKQGNLIAPDVAQEMIQQVVGQFQFDSALNFVADANTEALVQNVNQWKQGLESQVLNTLSAYAQQAQPEQLDQLLLETVLSILPLLEDIQLPKSLVDSLIRQVQSKFDLNTALTQFIDADTLAIAQKLIQSLQLGSIEELLKGSLLNNQASMGTSLIGQSFANMTESFVNDELKKLLGSDLFQFDLDVDAQQMVVKQVTFKMNIMQSSPPPSKSNEEIAAEVDSEVDRFKASRSSEPISFSF